MTENVNHDLKVDYSRDELARQHFVSGMRTYVLNSLSSNMRTVYDNKVAPNFKKKKNRAPKTAPEIHKALKSETIFKFYSSMRCNTQEMVWRSVIPGIERESEELVAKTKILSQSTQKANGTLTVDPKLSIPRYTAELDVHLMPGNYHEEHMPDDVSQGAIYDNGLSVFAMGFLGERMDDITQSVSTYFTKRYPDFKPKAILDMGCTLGHSTLPWKERYPQAEVTGIDVGAPSVRYAHGRAQSYGVSTHFAQKDAEHTGFADESFDVIYSCMFLHEIPKKNIRAIFKEAYRMLKPGGVMLHYELPPNSMLSAYDSFYLDWDSFYNKEPFYKAFRDSDPQEECVAAGFKKGKCFQYVAPSLNFYGDAAIAKAVADAKLDNKGENHMGRLVDGVQWFTFGAWK
ncbi:MAG: class I SAM-dependent methyltransferase [Alphaproteobacteria bacterium]|nr:class I SAM-dependent methyltransferase [Alphaproteobacteria bacterium]PHY00957.1 MAG: methyltransferase type 12 [Rhodospirillaceae bacterium]